MKIPHLLIDALETFPNFVIIDRHSHIVYLNECYARLLGIKRDAAIGKPVTDIIPGTLMPEIIESGQEQIGELMTLFDHTVGHNVTIVCNRIPLYRNGILIGAAAVTTMQQDITETISRLSDEIRTIRQENEQYKKKLNVLLKNYDALERIVGRSPLMHEIKQTIEDFAKSNLSILITGETGVGKELFARAIHELSHRRMNPYIKINCAAIPSELLESELFGYESGAFSGASKGGKIGKFELANNGTLLLDEIGEMPLTLQSKLLRVLQEQELERVGGLKPVKINVRIICCTNQNLEKLIENGKFRKDLYYRINTVELNIPPLRQRLEDIPELCQYFIDKHNMDNNVDVLGIDEPVLALFGRYSWPGNVRELEHVLERLMAVNNHQQITLKDCSFLKKRLSGNAAGPIPDANCEYTHNTLFDMRKDAEKEAILAALKKADGNKSKAARLLNIDRSMLYYKIKKLGLKL